MDSNEAIFNSIYQHNKWVNGSGSGSTPEYTGLYRIFLQKYLKDNNIKSVLDIGCGDWQFSKLIDWTGIDYLGVDVASVVIDKNKEVYSAPGISFTKLDITKEDVPNADVDLVIIKDCLQHLSNESVLSALDKLKNCKRVLVTQDIMGGNPNRDCNNGGFRYLDLRISPFTIPAKEVFRFDCKVKTTLEWFPREVSSDMWKLLQLLKSENGKTVRYGPRNDGGYVTPDLKFNKIITVGVGWCIAYEKDYIEKNPDTHIKFYDPTVNNLPSLIPNSQFFKLGVGLHPHPAYISMNNVVRRSKIREGDVTLLKIDCEGGEWDCGFEYADLTRVDAIILEIHGIGDEHMASAQLKVLEKLYDEYRCINIHPNNYGRVALCGGLEVPRVLELTFIRKDIEQTETNTPENYPNNPKAPDLKMPVINK